MYKKVPRYADQIKIDKTALIIFLKPTIKFYGTVETLKAQKKNPKHISLFSIKGHLIKQNKTFNTKRESAQRDGKKKLPHCPHQPVELPWHAL